MDGKNFFAGYIGGWIALLIELSFFGGSLFIEVLRGTFPESASQLSSMLANMAAIGLLLDVISGTLAAFDIGGLRDGAFGFLAGILTVIILFGGALSRAPPVLAGLWGDFFAVLLPIVIVITLAIIIQLHQQGREHSGQRYY